VTDPVVIADYDPGRPNEFERLRARALDALCDLPATVEHVGSTAVPGCAAKPVVDLDVVVETESDLAEAIRRLAPAGYRHQGDLGVPGREAFAWPAGEQRHHLYVVVAGNPAHRRHLALRDYLRAHPDDARAYGELKRELAGRFGTDRVAYTEAKTPFIERLLPSVRL